MVTQKPLYTKHRYRPKGYKSYHNFFHKLIRNSMLFSKIKKKRIHEGSKFITKKKNSNQID